MAKKLLLAESERPSVKKNLLALAVIIFAGVLLKLSFIFAKDIWRVDLYYYIEFARTAMDGGILYRDFGCSHPPLGYYEFFWIAKIFGYDNMYFGIKFSAIIIQTLMTYIVYVIFTSRRGFVSGILHALIFLVMISLHVELWEHNIPFTYLLPMFASIWFLLRNNFELSKISLFCAGLCLSLAVLLSTNVIFYALVIPVILIGKYRSDFRSIFLGCITAFLGFITPLMIFVLYFAYYGALENWYFWNIIWGSTYAGYKPWYVKIGHLFYGFIVLYQWLPFALLSFYGIFVIIRKKVFKTDMYALFVLAVFACGLIAKTIMNKPAQRYYLYLLPGLFFAMSYGFSVIRTVKVKRIIALVSAVLSAVFLVSTNLNAWKLRDDAAVKNREELRSWIKVNVPSDKTIWVWEEGFEIYYDTRRKKSHTSFFSPVEDLDKARLWKDLEYKNCDKMWNQFLFEIKQDPPAYIIDLMDGFKQASWEPKDGQREGIHKQYFDTFMNFVSEKYKIVYITSKNQRILERKDLLGDKKNGRKSLRQK